MKRSPHRTTVPGAHPPRRPQTKRPPAKKLPPAPVVEPRETSLLDIVDGLLNKGVILNADLILALAEVDLVYVRLSALLCAADRIHPQRRGRST